MWFTLSVIVWIKIIKIYSKHFQTHKNKLLKWKLACNTTNNNQHKLSRNLVKKVMLQIVLVMTSKVQIFNSEITTHKNWVSRNKCDTYFPELTCRMWVKTLTTSLTLLGASSILEAKHTQAIAVCSIGWRTRLFE